MWSGFGKTRAVQATVGGVILALAASTELRAQSCAGDCDGDGRVAVNELVRGVRINQEDFPASFCRAFDVNGDDRVRVSELVLGVDNSLNGCGPRTPGPTVDVSATPTDTPPAGTSTRTRVPTRTASATRTRTFTRTPTGTRTPRKTSTPRPTRTSTRTRRATSTRTPTRTRSATRTGTPTRTPRATSTPRSTSTETRTRRATSTRTPPRTRTFTVTRTSTRTPRSTRTATPSRSASATRTATGTRTATRTASGTRTATLTRTWTPTRSLTPTRTRTGTRSPTSTRTKTWTRGPSATRTATRTVTATRTQTGTRVPSATRTATLTRTPSSTRTATRTRTDTRTRTRTRMPTGTRTRTPTRSATLTRTPSLTRTASGTPTPSRTPTDAPSATPTIPGGGPVITHLGVLRADGVVVDPVGMTAEGDPIFDREIGNGFLLAVEAKSGIDRRPVGNSTFNANGTPDFLISSDRPLGNGSASVCDVGPSPPPGGVPAVDPPAIDGDQATRDALNDFACRFNPRRQGGDACSRNEFGEFAFVAPDSQVQFCTRSGVGAEIAFPLGDTRVTVAVRSVANQVGAARSFIVRVLP